MVGGKQIPNQNKEQEQQSLEKQKQAILAFGIIIHNKNMVKIFKLVSQDKILPFLQFLMKMLINWVVRNSAEGSTPG